MGTWPSERQFHYVNSNHRTRVSEWYFPFPTTNGRSDPPVYRKRHPRQRGTPGCEMSALSYYPEPNVGSQIFEGTTKECMVHCMTHAKQLTEWALIGEYLIPTDETIMRFYAIKVDDNLAGLKVEVSE
jgi:hypothetical protein